MGRKAGSRLSLSLDSKERVEMMRPIAGTPSDLPMTPLTTIREIRTRDFSVHRASQYTSRTRTVSLPDRVLHTPSGTFKQPVWRLCTLACRPPPRLQYPERPVLEEWRKPFARLAVG